MTSLGEIVLKFGATGEAGESPLRFTAAPINLLVGPNNAGKSLMLRELSGVNPRSRERSKWRAVQYPPTRIVEEVHWDQAGAQAIQQELLAGVFSDSPAWDELKLRTWDLLPAIDAAVPQLTEIRAKLSSTLFELAGTYLAEFKDVVAGMVQSDAKGFAPLVIGGAVILLQATRMSTITVDPAEPGTAGPVSARRSGPLTPEQAVAIHEALEGAWARCESVFRSLGVDTENLSFAKLLDRNAFGGALLTEMAKNPLLSIVIGREQGLLDSVQPTVTALEHVRRFMSVGGWLLDPEPLTSLATQLRKAYAEETWANPERRALDAKDVLYLDGMARLSATRSAELKAYAEEDDDLPAILALFKQPDMMDLLRTLTRDALGGNLVLDMTSKTPKVIWRLAQEDPPKGLETSYSEEADQFHASAALLDERSDGIHAFAGMLAAIVAKPSNRVFIDEPEAFLHPPLVRQLARQLCLISREWDTQFFIATHSADLLEAFAAGGAEVNIIRLTHDDERSTARLLNSTDLRHLARDPLLRSEATLSALFHDGAVVCEAAGDRVLYSEINERLLAHDGEALDSCVFLNAQNWDTIPRMVAPLRRMGVAAAAILDADVLFAPGFTSMLDAAQVDKVIRDGWIKQRDGLRDKIAKRNGFDVLKSEKKPDDEKRHLQLKGKVIAGLKPVEKRILANLLDSMAKYGVFIVPVGELEDWLAQLGFQPPAKDGKRKWLRQILEQMGEDPRSETYVHPGEGDIWDFMRSVNAWICNPDREGTSSTTRQTD